MLLGTLMANVVHDGFQHRDRRAHNTSFAMSWNEIEIVDVRRFREPDIAGFAEAVDATNHIFDRRRAHVARFDSCGELLANLTTPDGLDALHALYHSRHRCVKVVLVGL